MKKTVTANIGNLMFHIDEDAYELLIKYLTSLKNKYKDTEGHEEIISDIESRVAEILQTKLSTAKQVINMDDANNVIEIMGKPEDFEGDERNDKTEGDDNYRKLYRDDDDKIVAGVCSGIASYFSTDPLWVRIAFIVTTLLFSAGLWIYLVLWLIVPKAKTTREKLEMKGKKINISNIEQTIKEDINDLKDKIKEFSNEAGDVLKNKKKNRKGADRFFHFIFLIAKYFVKSIGIIIGILFIFIGVFLLIGFVSSFFNIFPIQIGDGQILLSGITIPELLNLIYPAPFYIYISILGIVFLIATPLIIFVYYGFKLVFGFKYRSKIIGFSSFSLWIIGLVLCLISGFQIARSFSNKALVTEKITSSITAEQKVKLDIQYLEEEKLKFENEALQLGHLSLTSDSGRNVFMGEPQIEIVDNNRAGEIEILLLYTSRGENKETAVNNAKGIYYPATINDSIIQLPAYFYIKNNLKWRMQNLKVQVKIPNNNDVIYSKSTREYLEKSGK